ncbi:SMI1/KNR4 family protein [Kineosporia rhizophila]|uniref:SMI1/KNR4 family protein n=1 Tax=Kineosporia rhizophila TaxID=84633 RepID=UPI001E2CAFE2|nr:SMI1/KNR4 family protein [Kineosporia rhizophila]MCE0540443.1 SMI1/KNR4 family protein [Kineosporia rhizophila]
MTVEGTRSEAQWRLYLAEYSVEVLESADENANLEISDQQRADRWLGFDGADTDQLAELEQRLGIGLPPSYRTFLAVSDGWLELGPFLWTMRTTGEVGWARDTDPLLHSLLQHEQDELAGLADRALLISKQGDAQYWILDSGDVSAAGEWAAYTWSSWHPGPSGRFESFAALVDAARASAKYLREDD